MKGKRREGVKQTIGLIVEGDTEFVALPRLHTKRLIPGCPPLKAVNLGGVGSDRTAAGIAKLVLPKVIEHRLRGLGRVIICLDREQRSECAPGLATAIVGVLESELEKKGHSIVDVSVVIADRTFEAWLLGGWPQLVKSSLLKQAPKWTSFEGELGLEGKKGGVELGKLLGRPYGKMTDGPRLFEALDFAEARAHGPGRSGSRSLDKFLRSLGV